MSSYILDAYRPQVDWYRYNPYGIHGLAHAARVLLWVEQLGPSLLKDGEPLEMEVVRWAAAVHDVGRVDDGRDLLHGKRSAEWAEANSAHFGSGFSAGQLAQLAYVCTWHVPDDRDAPLLTPELRCLKDADGLDRVRIHDLNPHRLRSERARALCDRAQDLYDASRREPGDPWDAVKACALRMGLWH